MRHLFASMSESLQRNDLGEEDALPAQRKICACNAMSLMKALNDGEVDGEFMELFSEIHRQSDLPEFMIMIPKVQHPM